MATLTDDAGTPVVVIRTIDVTPENPGPGPAGPNINVPAVTLSVAVSGVVKDPNLNLPAIALAVRLHAASSNAPDHVAVPAVTIKVAVHGVLILVVPPVTVQVGMHGSAASASIQLTSPADGDTVEIAEPKFVVALNAHSQTDEFTIEVQYADNPLFVGAITLAATVTAIDGGAYFSPTGAVPGHTYWRARLKDSDANVIIDWSAAIQFDVDTTLDPSDLAVTWAVDTVTRPIHLWHVVPDAAAVGDTATAYGQGFPASGSVLIDGIPCTVTSWQRNSAVINSTTAGRHIDADDIDPEHYQIDFIVPIVQPPGGVLEVRA